jgi:predicted cupin superfamily sugar epimerase
MAPPTPSVNQLVEIFELEPLPVEGGLFHQTWRSHRHWPGNDKPAGTAIVALLDGSPDGFSALHRLPTDEVYHFYLGDPIEVLELHPDGRAERVVLGHDVLGGQRVQHVVAAQTWMGARLLPAGGPAGWALFGTTMAPGFTPDDYEGGTATELAATYPAEADLIERLTRPAAPTAMPVVLEVGDDTLELPRLPDRGRPKG